MKVLMVCLGNICRSPMAQGVLEKKASESGIDIFVDSAGTANYHEGEAPDQRAINKAAENGIDISYYRGRQFQIEDFEEFDHIFTMDAENHKNILALTEDSAKQEKVRMILNLTSPNSNMSVPDPYFGGEEGFENVYQLLDAACEVFLKENNIEPS